MLKSMYSPDGGAGGGGGAAAGATNVSLVHCEVKKIKHPRAGLDGGAGAGV